MKTGRPRLGESPRYDVQELDRLLVHGYVDPENGMRIYPSYRELGRKYGVSNSIIAQFSKKHNCLKRRAEQEMDSMWQAYVHDEEDHCVVVKKEIVRFILEWLSDFSNGKTVSTNTYDFVRMARLAIELAGGEKVVSGMMDNLIESDVDYFKKKLISAMGLNKDSNRTFDLVGAMTCIKRYWLLMEARKEYMRQKMPLLG